ncbi:MAG: hypothetical protein H8D87_09020 [Deltaproteobacteria bacterium]|uniref:hypothetical protein n=1 Tax=Desulfobacula sp. TaxID=2593537 RepID=UPI001996DD6B|nr:hypothetical protein [Candidatus Desulfobacula maris]MBL6995071.1 hypothetical protein [Desulfobacula sp.]
MEKKVILIIKNPKEANQLSLFLSENQYLSNTIDGLESLDQCINTFFCNIVIFDFDSISVDNQTIRKLTLQYPQICFLCISKDRFHPELKDAICYHIYACLNKPLDYAELLYWLRCIEDNESDKTPNAEKY